MKPKENYCINCEETKQFKRGRCVGCRDKYDNVVPMSYRTDLPMEHLNTTNSCQVPYYFIYLGII